MECPGCQTPNPDENRFCTVCGTALPSVCPRCGAPSAPEARFCGACGASLAAGAPAPPAGEDRLARFVPRALAEKIRATRGQIEGERRQVTVVFCDLVDSTAIAEEIGAEAYHRLLDEYTTLHSAERPPGSTAEGSRRNGGAVVEDEFALGPAQLSAALSTLARSSGETAARSAFA